MSKKCCKSDPPCKSCPKLAKDKKHKKKKHADCSTQPLCFFKR